MEFNLLFDFRPGLAIPAVSHPRQVDDGEGIHYGRYKITSPYSQDVPKGMPSAGYMYVYLYIYIHIYLHTTYTCEYIISHDFPLYPHLIWEAFQ